MKHLIYLVLTGIILAALSLNFGCSWYWEISASRLNASQEVKLAPPTGTAPELQSPNTAPLPAPSTRPKT